MLQDEYKITPLDDISLPIGETYIVRHSSASSSIPVEMHYHDHYEAFYALSGSIIYTIEGCNYKLEPGTLLLIPPFEQHQLYQQRDATFERIAVRFNKEILKELSTLKFDLSNSFNPSNKGYINLLKLNATDQDEMLYLLRGLLRESMSPAFGADITSKAYLAQFLVLINRISKEDTLEKTIMDSASILINRIMEYIEINYMEVINLDILEKKFNINKYQISRDFSRIVGCPLHKYLVQKRLAMALNQLKKGITPQQAAINCGFSDYSTFYRQFRTTYCTSPRGYIENIKL